MESGRGDENGLVCLEVPESAFLHGVSLALWWWLWDHTRTPLKWW